MENGLGKGEVTSKQSRRELLGAMVLFPNLDYGGGYTNVYMC